MWTPTKARACAALALQRTILDMLKSHLLTITAAVLIGNAFVRAQTQSPPTTAPSADNAQQVLKDSPRHGEWADIALSGSDVKIHTWVVYPERKDKAPVVLVIHE